jgi:hypothetical protein
MHQQRDTGYGVLSTGSALPPTPEGWEIIPEGEEIPQQHRECLEEYTNNKASWVFERRCHSTMTAIKACVWGSVRAYARNKHDASGSSQST